jgi:uncharacterized protein YqeY
MSDASSPADEVRSRFRHALGTAMKARDTVAVAALRSALAAIDNAEAADCSDAPSIERGTIAGGVAGLGAGEVARRVLTDREVTEIVLAQVAEWRATAAEYERAGRDDPANRLRVEAAILGDFLADGHPEA